MLRPKPTMISLSMKDVTEHLESIDRKAAKARAEGTVNSSSMRQPLGALKNETTPITADEPRVIYLNERDARIQGITPVPISTDMLHSFDLTIRSRSSADSADQTPRVRSHETMAHDDAENRTTTTASQDDDSVSLGFLESDREDEEPDFIEDQDFMMTEVPGASPLPRAPRPSLDYSSFEGSSRDSSPFGEHELSPNITIRKPWKPSIRLTIQVPEDASTPSAPISEAAQNNHVQRLRARHPLPRSPLFRSIDPAQTPIRQTTIGLAPRLNSPGTPSTLFSQPPRSSRTYRQREMTYSYEESENPNAGETEVYEDETADPHPYDDESYYDEHEDDVNYYQEEDGEEEIRNEGELRDEEQADAEQQLDNMFHGVHSLRYRERSSHHDSSTTDDMDEALPSSPPMYIGGAGGVDGNMSRSSRILVQNLQSAAMERASVRTGLPPSPSLQLPPPFSASLRRVSDNNALPAMPPMMPSSDDDRGRTRTRFPRLGDDGRPSSLEAHAGDSSASPASAQSPYDNIQQDGSPGSANTALPFRLTHTDGSPCRSSSPMQPWHSRITGAFPERTPVTATLPRSVIAGAEPSQSSPYRDRLLRRSTSPTVRVRPSGPPFTLAPEDMMSSSTDGADHGSTPTQVYPRPPPPPPPPPPPNTPASAASGLTPSGSPSTPGTARAERVPWVAVPDRSQPTLPIRLPPRTPGRGMSVYDDRAPAEGQPQTPDDLPESRHRSRFHPSYTAPPPQRIEARDYRNNGREYTMSEMRIRRGRGTRSDSPLGMRGGGYEGLHGGKENGDDALLYQRGQEFARRRLFVDEQEMRGVPRRVSGRWGNEWMWEREDGRIERMDAGVARNV